jgi:hypothetical protein
MGHASATGSGAADKGKMKQNDAIEAQEDNAERFNLENIVRRI